MQEQLLDTTLWTGECSPDWVLLSAVDCIAVTDAALTCNYSAYRWCYRLTGFTHRHKFMPSSTLMFTSLPTTIRATGSAGCHFLESGSVYFFSLVLFTRRGLGPEAGLNAGAKVPSATVTQLNHLQTSAFIEYYHLNFESKWCSCWFCAAWWHNYDHYYLLLPFVCILCQK